MMYRVLTLHTKNVLLVVENGYNKIPGIGKNNRKYDGYAQLLLSYSENLLEEEVLMMKELLMPLH